MIKILLSSIALILSLTSCISSKNEPVLKQQTYPSWYINSIPNDYLYLYGNGEGENIDEAVKNALSDISYKLSTSISSNLEINQNSYKDFREYVTKEVSSNVSSKSENLTFRNYEINKSEKISFNKFIVNVKVEKQKFVESIKNEFDGMISKNNTNLTNLNLDDKLTNFLTLKDFLFKLHNFQNKAEIISILDNSFEVKKYYSLTRNVYDKMIGNKRKVSFQIENKTNNTLVEKLITQSLNQNGFNVSNENSKYKMILSSKVNKKSPQGFYIVDYYLNAEIEFDNKILKSYIFESKGVSSNSFEDAKNSAIEKLKIDINRFF